VKGWLGAFFVFLLVASTIAGIFWTFGRAAEARQLLHQWLPRVSAMDRMAFHATSVAMLVVAEWILLLALLRALNAAGLNPSKSSYSSLLDLGTYGALGVFLYDDLFHFSEVVKWAQTYLIVASGWEWLGVAPIKWILCAFFFCVWLICSLLALIPPGVLLNDDPDKPGPVGS
jgi:disulfide bond formation protein DsbB